MNPITFDILSALYLCILTADAPTGRRPPPPPPPPSAPVYQNNPGSEEAPAPETEKAEDHESADEEGKEADQEDEDILLDAYSNQTRKMRTRDWYIYYAYVACIREEDFDKCALYAEAAAALDPKDDTAEQLYDIAARRGGQGSEKRRKFGGGSTRLGPVRSRHRLGVGVMVLLGRQAHSGYLINPEYIFEFKNRSTAFMQLGFGGLVGSLTFRKGSGSAEQPETSVVPGTMLERSIVALAGGVRVRFQIGAQFDMGRRSLLRFHGGVSGGLLGAKINGDERSLFFQVIPEAGITYHLGRLSLGVMAMGSSLTASDESTVSQGFGVGISPKFTVGF